MNRHSVLPGAGLLVGTGDAALGAGAFANFSAERSISIETSSNAKVFLRLDPDTQNYTNSGYITESNGIIQIDVTPRAEGDFDGTGANPFMSATPEEVFPVEIKRTQDVEAPVTLTNLSPGDPSELFATNVPRQRGQLSLLDEASGSRSIETLNTDIFGEREPRSNDRRRYRRGG